MFLLNSFCQPNLAFLAEIFPERPALIETYSYYPGTAETKHKYLLLQLSILYY